MKNVTFKTTTDLLAFAGHVQHEAMAANSREEFARFADVAEQVKRHADDILMSGAFEGQARKELLAASYLLSTGMRDVQQAVVRRLRKAEFFA